MNTFKISVIIPCYNEVKNIKDIYGSISNQIGEHDYEILFVDDNSSDGTLSLIEDLSILDHKVKYISLSRNFGHQSALRAGLSHSSGDCIISMDADLQHPPEVLPKMILKWREGYDIVYTKRCDSKTSSLFKQKTSSLFYFLYNKLSDTKIEQGVADFRLIDKKIAKILVEDISEYHLFYRGLIKWIGYKQFSIEYFSKKRNAGKSKYTFSKMIFLASDGITSFSIKPLKFSILIGFGLAFFAACYSIYAFGMYLYASETVKGWTSILLSVLFIGGVNMILMGIIGEYIGKIFIQTKNRPHYLIKKTNLNIE